MNAGEVLELLRAHYLPENRPPGVLFMPEIGSPDGRRRADLLVAPVSIAGARGGALIGHEIKVSRSDVLAELADPTKADPWMQFCTRWWLVVSDPALVEGLDIPEAWGIMAPPSGRRRRSMTILREAPELTPSANPYPALTRISAFIVSRVEDKTRRHKYEMEQWQGRAERAEKTIEERRTIGEFGHLSEHAKRVGSILQEVKKRSYEDRTPGVWWFGDVEDETIIETLVDHCVVRAANKSARDHIHRVIDNAERAVAPLGQIAQALKALESETV